MITSLALLSIHKSPAIPLADVCEKYFAPSYEEALKKAMLYDYRPQGVFGGKK